MNNIEKKLIKLANEIKNLYETDRDNVIVFAKNGEYEVALDSLYHQLYEYDIKITKKQYDEIKELAEEMEIDESNYIFLKSLIED